MNKKQIKTILVVLFIATSATSFSQTKAMLNQTKYEFNGDVEQVFLESFKVNFRNDSMYLKYDSGLIGIESQLVFFHSNGKLKEKHEYASFCGGDSIVVDKVWVYHFTDDQLDSVTTKNLNSLTTNKIEFSRPYSFVYDTDSSHYMVTDFTVPRISRITDTSYKRIREYLNKDSISYITEVTYKDSLGRGTRSESYSNDKLNRLTIRQFFKSSEDEIIDTYSIDINRNRIRRTQNHINKRGEIIKTTIYRTNGEYQTHFTREYEYDNRGNWIEQKRISKNGKITNLFRRTIKYRSSR